MDTCSIARFQNGDDVIYSGDAIQVLRDEIEDASVHLIFADPPYNIGKRFGNLVDRWPSDEAYAEWCYDWLALCLTKLVSSGSMYVMASTQSMPYIDLYLRKHAHILSRIVWHYDSSGVQARRHFGSMYEPILFCVKDKHNYTFNSSAILVEAKTGAQRRLIDHRRPTPAPYNSVKVPGNVWYFPRVRYRMPEYENHPSQKPEALLERIILVSSDPGQVVMDPFSGTFTTSAVAQRLDRATMGIESHEEYVRIGLRRLGVRHSFNAEVRTGATKTHARTNRANQMRLPEVR